MPWFEREVQVSAPEQVSVKLPTKIGDLVYEEECHQVQWGRMHLLVSSAYDLEPRLGGLQHYARMTPYKLLKPLKNIVFAKHWNIQAAGLGCGSLGLVLFSSGSVPRLGNQSKWRSRVWLHELAHLQRDCCGPLGGRAQWREFCEADSERAGSKWVSPYATQTESMSEDWAESVAYYIQSGWAKRGFFGEAHDDGWTSKYPARAAWLRETYGE